MKSAVEKDPLLVYSYFSHNLSGLDREAAQLLGT